MLKLVSAVAVAFAVVLAGCASQPAGVGSSGINPTDTWKGPFPEQPGYNRWNRPAPA